MDIRNIAIIAHVDHGKTTLVDALLKQSGTFRENQATVERALDSNDLERERGITILAKATSVEWHGHRINIVDTPGHADFGGEVERILGMVDGVLLLVDAAEGPMPQTKFVTAKALRLGLRPIVVLNKVDKPDAEPDRALNEVFDLFVTLDADEGQLDFPVLYASGRAGWADAELDGPRRNLDALYQLILDHVPAPAQAARRGEPFSMLATTLAADPFLGRLLTGRIESGKVRTGQTVHALSRDGAEIERFRVSRVLAFRGLTRTAVEEAEAGDIVSLAGMAKATVADTIADLAVSAALPAQPIDPPTISVTFGINDSPAGRPRRRQGPVPRHPRAADARGGVERRDPRQRHPRRRGLRGGRPRRAADGGAGREHAPRGLRALGLPPARPLPRGRRQAAGAGRGGDDRRRRGILRRRGRQALASARASSPRCAPAPGARRASSRMCPRAG